MNEIFDLSNEIQFLEEINLSWSSLKNNLFDKSL